MKKIILKKGDRVWLYEAGKGNKPYANIAANKDIEFKESDICTEDVFKNRFYLYKEPYPKYGDVSIMSIGWPDQW